MAGKKDKKFYSEKFWAKLEEIEFDQGSKKATEWLEKNGYVAKHVRARKSQRRRQQLEERLSNLTNPKQSPLSYWCQQLECCTGEGCYRHATCPKFKEFNRRYRR